jgi:hypothetical protein
MINNEDSAEMSTNEKSLQLHFTLIHLHLRDS